MDLGENSRRPRGMSEQDCLACILLSCLFLPFVLVVSCSIVFSFFLWCFISAGILASFGDMVDWKDRR